MRKYRGYGVAFCLEQYQRLAELAQTIQGKMIISVNDVPAMRQVFAVLAMERVGICYTVGTAEKRRETGELVIRSFEGMKRPHHSGTCFCDVWLGVR